MSTLLVKNAALIVTMDAQDRELRDAAIFCRDGFIEQIGPAAELPAEADEVLDLAGHIVLPGLINTHHHFYQTLTRALPAAQDANLFNWLKTLYPIWARMDPEAVFISTQTALAELALSGSPPLRIICTCSPTVPAWMTKLMPPLKSAYVCTPRAVR